MLDVSALGGGWLIPLVALVISVATFVFSIGEMHRRAKVDYVDELEHRIQECEADRKQMRGEIEKLKDENWRLTRRLLRLENGGDK